MMTSLQVDHPGVRRTTLAALWVTLIALLSGGVRPESASDSEFMQYNADERLVQLTVTAGYDATNSGFNLNGGFRGSHRITVPAGWKVRVTFANADVIPHSIGIVREQKRVPVRFEKPAFAGAASRPLEGGIPRGARQDDITFVASLPGAYLLACGVPGHAFVGSYLRFTVSADAAVPTYETGLVADRSAPKR